MAGDGAQIGVNLTNPARSVNKATYAPAVVAADAPHPDRVLEKAAYIRRLMLTEAEYRQLRGSADTPESGTGMSRAALDLVANVVGSPGPADLRRFGPRLAQADHQDLAMVGQALAALRKADGAGSARRTAAGPVTAGEVPVSQQAVSAAPDPGGATQAVVDAFRFHTPIQPFGALYLERLEMTLVGVEHGELVHSGPLTPHETVIISHRKWTVTTQTFECLGK